LPTRPQAQGAVDNRRELMRTAAAFVTELGRGFADAVDPDTELLLLSTTTAPLGRHLAEAMGIRAIGLYLQPTAPTGDFPPNLMGTRSLGRLGNRTVGHLALRMADRVYTEAVTELRRRLDLPALAPAELRRRQERANWPVLHGFSTALVPRPSDWREGLDIVGAWWPYLAPDRRLPAEVEDFLAAGPRPAFIGFGSMAAGHGERLSEIAVEALRRAGLRGIVQAGSAGLAADGHDVLTIGDVPHALLFPRVAAVVHHAGAGTAAAALRAGAPSIPVPVTADQPFWAARLASIGAATAPIPFAALTAGRLADALGQAVRQQRYARAASVAARHMATEDGVGAVLKVLG
ncbi:nucleotide disphospho-sugar-binding domain-containing protein, partial [Streptomyces sp. NPDC006356]